MHYGRFTFCTNPCPVRITPRRVLAPASTGVVSTHTTPPGTPPHTGGPWVGILRRQPSAGRVPCLGYAYTTTPQIGRTEHPRGCEAILSYCLCQGKGCSGTRAGTMDALSLSHVPPQSPMWPHYPPHPYPHPGWVDPFVALRFPCPAYTTHRFGPIWELDAFRLPVHMRDPPLTHTHPHPHTTHI